jgi:hypothetical protein
MPCGVDDGETSAEAYQVSLPCHDLKGHYAVDVLVVPQTLPEQIDGHQSEQQRR